MSSDVMVVQKYCINTMPKIKVFISYVSILNKKFLFGNQNYFILIGSFLEKKVLYINYI